MTRKRQRLEQLPPLMTDEEAERFVDEVDLTQFDLSGGTRIRFKFDERNSRINLRIPKSLLDTIKQHAKARGVPYQRLIRETLEQALIGN